MEVLEPFPQEYRGTIVVKFGRIQKLYVNFLIARVVGDSYPHAIQGSALHSLQKSHKMALTATTVSSSFITSDNNLFWWKIFQNYLDPLLSLIIFLWMWPSCYLLPRAELFFNFAFRHCPRDENVISEEEFDSLQRLAACFTYKKDDCRGLLLPATSCLSACPVSV